MPDTQYFTNIDGKYVKDAEARQQLNDLEDYVETITPVSLSVTENGTYTAPTGVFGYSPVVVNTPTGSEIISKADWDAMTKAQKQAKGVVGIQKANSGYNRGDLVNGADYGVSLISTSNNILAEAFYDDYVAGSTSWDNFTLSSAFTVNQDGTLSTDEDKIAYYDLGSGNIDCTVYLVAKHKNAMHHSAEVICSLKNSGGYGNEPYIGMFSSSYPRPQFWTGNSDTGYYRDVRFISADEWHVYALALHYGSKRFADMRIDDTTALRLALETSGQYAVIGGYSTNVDSTCNLDIKYAAITNGHDGSSIGANIKTIMDYFGITG